MVDLTDLPNLEIYTLAEMLEHETKENRLLWFHRMAKQGLLVCYCHNHYSWRAEKILSKLARGFKSLSEDYYFVEAMVPTPHGSQFRTCLGKIPLKEATHRIEVNQDVFQVWCKNAGYPLPRFWFGEQQPAEPMQQIRALTEDLKTAGKNYAVTERKKGTPAFEIKESLKTKYGFKGQELHDAIWPEDNGKKPGAKNTALSRVRSKSKSND